HHALHVKRLVQGLHFLGRSKLGRVDTAFEPRESRGIAVNVRMAVACAGRNGEVDRRGWLRRLGECRSRAGQGTGGDRAEHNITSRCHDDPPGWTADLAIEAPNRAGAVDARMFEASPALRKSSYSGPVTRST